MFSKIANSLKVGNLHAKTTKILLGEYRIEADHDTLMTLAGEHIGKYSEHELAVCFINYFIAECAPMFETKWTPEQIDSKLNKWVRVGKYANENGFIRISNKHLVDELRNVVQELGFDFNSIDAAPY